MLFNFQLRPLSDVTPWVYSEQLYLQWFGLTEGCYWLQMNDKDEFFRYSADLLAYWQENYPTEPVRPPYADYYVVRFWEDLLEILPVILQPLHPRLTQMLEKGKKSILHVHKKGQTRHNASGHIQILR